MPDYSAVVRRLDFPVAIKRVTKRELVELGGKSRDLHLGVGRRADWATAHVADAPAGVLRAIFTEPSPQLCYRCWIVVRRSDEDAFEHFSLDVLPDDFDRLPDITGDALVRLARWALDQVPFSPLPEEYQAEWDAARRTDRTT